MRVGGGLCLCVEGLLVAVRCKGLVGWVIWGLLLRARFWYWAVMWCLEMERTSWRLSWRMRRMVRHGCLFSGREMGS